MRDEKGKGVNNQGERGRGEAVRDRGNSIHFWKGERRKEGISSVLQRVYKRVLGRGAAPHEREGLLYCCSWK